MNLIKEGEVIETQCVYSKFPKSKFLIAVFDKVKDFYLEEFSEIMGAEVKDIDDWYFSGIAEDSPGTYYVMDMIKVFYNLKTGEIILFNDSDIVTGSFAYSALRAEDAIIIYTLNNNFKLKELL